jgi:rhodanese-related sulfurtransferase
MRTFFYIFLLLVSTNNLTFDKELRSLLELNTAIVSIDEIIDNTASFVFLDAREPNEYAVSHIPGALNIGYNRWDTSLIENIDKDQPIIVYCSVGYRSEKITKRIEALGYSNVANLYGSIFEWANCNLPLEDSDGKTSHKIHTYNRKWSKWVTNPKINKQW